MESKTIFFNGKWYNEKNLKELLKEGIINNLKKNKDYQSYIKKNKQSWNNTTNEMLKYAIVNRTVNDVFKKITENSIKTINN